jgi:quinol monooxygenase YgiN
MADFGMVGTLATAPENREALLHILTQAADLMRDVDGCLLYAVCKDANDESLVWVMELWTSKAAHDESLSQPRVRELIGQAMPMLTGNPDGVSLIPVGGKGL